MPNPPRLEVLAQPFGGQSLGAALTAELQRGRWASFRAVVAFLKRSGFRQLAPPLDSFLAAGGRARLTVGIDHDGTSLEGLQDLWRLVDSRADLYVFKEGQGGQLRTFHPKAFIFENPPEALAIIGSGNWTGGGLFTNHELGVRIELDLTDPGSDAYVAALTAAMDAWQTPSPACRSVDRQLLISLAATGQLLPESVIAAGKRAAGAATRSGAAVRTAGRPTEFGPSGASALPPMPGQLPELGPAAVVPAPRPSSPTSPAPAQPAPPPPGTPSAHQAFLIEVRPHANGEIFLSKRAKDEDPGFFGWPFTGWTTPKRPGPSKEAENPPYPMAAPDPQVELVVYDARGRVAVSQAHSLNLVYYEPKSEVRITIPPEPLAVIPELSLLVMTRNPTAQFDYRLEFYPPSCNTPEVQRYRSQLVNELPSGGAPIRRRYGWA